MREKTVGCIFTRIMMISVILTIIIFAFPKGGTARGLSEDGRLNFIQLGEKYGHTVEEYKVVTEDGYILKLFRIRGDSKVPVLLMHGLLDSADTWLIRGNTSLAITLANQRYDVWAGNSRGNKYSRAHISLDPDTDEEFWNFSFNEVGYYDMPATIDTVLKLTDADKVNVIGHSQGNTIFYVMGSTRPEYNDKVNLLIALAPICYLQNVQPPLKTIFELSPALYYLNVRELFAENSTLIAQWRTFCPEPVIGYAICIEGILFPINGYDSGEVEPNFTPTLVGHFPAGSSVKSVNHYAQVALRRKFAKYDYGEEANIAIYNSSMPPEYDLSKVKLKVALLVGANDKLSTLGDVAILRRKLPNVIQYLLIPRIKMNHASFVWGLHMKDYLFPYIFELL